MYLMDYHIHSNNSFDSEAFVKDVCEKAIEKGIKEICFTEHYSTKEAVKSHGFLKIKKYVEEIEECRATYKEKLEIRMGLELCEPHEDEKGLSEFINSHPFDFILGSIHNFDGSTGLQTYSNSNTKDESYSRYFDEVDHVSESPVVDIVAHMDLMKRYAFNKHGNYSLEEYSEKIEKVLKNIIARGKGIEVNTSSLRGIIGETMPGNNILKMYYELGGRIITVGSDAHKVEDVGAGIIETYEVLKKIGFKSVYSFNKRKWKEISI